MPAVAPANDFVPVPSVGRRFEGAAEVRLGDTDPSGWVRLDALARYLQDVANDDARDAALPNAAGWVVRRTMVDIVVPARLAERLTLVTFCAGTGRSWAERRTTIRGDQDAMIEAVSLWVQVDATSGRPVALDGAFHERYGSAAAGRRVSARLALPGLPPGAQRRSWPVRAVDLDVFGHVNNAVQLAIIEELLDRSGPVAPGQDAPIAEAGDGSRRSTTNRTGLAEIEYIAPLDHVAAELCWAEDAAPAESRAPVAPTERAAPVDPTEGEAGSDHGGLHRAVGAWLAVDGEVRTAARWSPASPSRACQI